MVNWTDEVETIGAGGDWTRRFVGEEIDAWFDCTLDEAGRPKLMQFPMPR